LIDVAKEIVAIAVALLRTQRGVALLVASVLLNSTAKTSIELQ
jgi:hypothetical protein